jgi:hypothetical protein
MGYNLTLYTFIGHNAADYAENLRNHCEALKSGCNTITYRCIRTVGNPQYDQYGIERIPEGWEHLDDVESHEYSNSCCHAIGIHRAIKEVEQRNERFNIFIDADTCILYKDWDLHVLRALMNNNLRDGCLSWGSDHKTPTVFFFAFNREILYKVEYDFFPTLKPGIETSQRVAISDLRASKAYKTPIGSIIKCDTGWKLPDTLYKASIPYECMQKVAGAMNKTLLPYKDEAQRMFCLQKPTHMAEWHWNGELFGTHKQACRSHSLDSVWGTTWKSRIDLYMSNRFGFVVN